MNISLVLKGMAMGMAEAIPGVSGGTIAFITGIYEQLLDSISAASGVITEPRLLLKPKELWDKINGTFLLFLIGGMLVGIVSGVFAISYLLEQYPEPLWGFFMGLILASCFYMLKDVKPFTGKSTLALLIGTAIGLLVVTQSPVEASHSLPMIFFAGAIAISALILPGISGSFILLLLGLYSYIIPLLKDILSGERLDESMVILVFALGCFTGLSTFSRLLSYLFDRYRKTTIALMIGFMLGSLYKLWPWRNVTSTLDDEGNLIAINAESLSRILSEDLRILTEQNVLPAEYWGEPRTFITVVFVVLGALSVLALTSLSSESK